MVDSDTRRRRGYRWGWIVSSLALAAIGLVAVPFFGLMVMASDSCGSPEERPICDPGNQQLMFFLPMGALAVGLLLAVGGGVLTARRRRSSAPWQLGAWLLLVVAGMVSCGIATAGPSPAYQRQQAEQDARERAEREAALTARPDYEVMRTRFEEMQQHIQSQLQVSLPTVDWPLVLDSTMDSSCGGDGLRAQRLRGSATSDATLTDAQWIALDTVVRGITTTYGFSGPPLRLHPTHAPTGLALQGPDQAYLRVYASGGGRFTVTVESACYLPTPERARLPVTTTATPS